MPPAPMRVSPMVKSHPPPVTEVFAYATERLPTTDTAQPKTVNCRGPMISSRIPNIALKAGSPKYAHVKSLDNAAACCGQTFEKEKSSSSTCNLVGHFSCHTPSETKVEYRGPNLIHLLIR